MAVARYALHTNLLTPFTWVGLALLAVVTLLGPAASVTSQGTWSFQPGLLGTGFVFGALFVFRSGLVEQRMGGLQTFLRENFISPMEHVLGAIISLLATWVGFALCTFLLALAVSAGDVGMAAWMAWVLFLASGLMLPFVLLVEAVSELRTPLFVPAFMYFAALLVMSAWLGQPRTSAILGLELDPARPSSSIPLAARTAAVLLLGFAAVLAGTWARARRGSTRTATDAP